MTVAFGTYTFPETFTVEGLGFDMRLDDAPVPRRHGSRIIASVVGTRTVRVKGVIHSINEGTAWSDLNNMLRSLAAAGQQGLLLRTGIVMDCWLDKFGHDFVPGANPNVANVKADFKASNPFPRSTVAGLTVVGLTSTAVDFALTNAGTADAYPVFNISAPGLSILGTVSIRSLNTGDEIQFTKGIPDGSTIIIDTDVMTCTLDGRNAVDGLAGTFPRLLPGTNTIRVSGGTMLFQAEWYDRYYA